MDWSVDDQCHFIYVFSETYRKGAMEREKAVNKIEAIYIHCTVFILQEKIYYGYASV